FVVHDEVIHRIRPVVQRDHPRSESLETQALVLFSSEDHRLAVLDKHDVVFLCILFGECEKGAVVEDVAVLINFEEGGAAVFGRAADHRLHMFWIAVESPRDEGCLGAKSDKKRIKRMVDRSIGSRFCYLTELRGGGVLTLRQAVDLIVEEQDLQIDVPTAGVDEMVPADTEPVTITG